MRKSFTFIGASVESLSDNSAIYCAFSKFLVIS